MLVGDPDQPLPIPTRAAEPLPTSALVPSVSVPSGGVLPTRAGDKGVRL